MKKIISTGLLITCVAIAQENSNNVNRLSLMDTSIELLTKKEDHHVEIKEQSITEKDWSIGDFEKAGYVLGSISSKAECPNVVESSYGSSCSGNSRNKFCRVGRSILCFDDSNGIFSDFEYILPGKCGDKTTENLLNPHKVDDANNLLVSGDKARFWNTTLNCSSDDEDNLFVKVDFRLGEHGDNLDGIISTLSFPPTKKLYQLGKSAWYSGKVSGFSNTATGENYCVKKYPESEARMIEKGTGQVGMGGITPEVIRNSGSKTIDTKFVCYQKIEYTFEEKKFFSLAQKANDDNQLLPPSKQKPEGYYDKKFLGQLISEARKQIKCPAEFSKFSESHDLSSDYYAIECQTNPMQMSNLCPKGSKPTGGHIGGDTVKNKLGETITTLIYSVSDSCFKPECYPGTFVFKKNYCAACPKGTTFDPRETEQFYKKEKISLLEDPQIILCRGSSLLDAKTSDTQNKDSLSE